MSKHTRNYARCYVIQIDLRDGSPKRTESAESPWTLSDSKIGFEMSLIVVEAIRGQSMRVS